MSSLACLSGLALKLKQNLLTASRIAVEFKRQEEAVLIRGYSL